MCLCHVSDYMGTCVSRDPLIHLPQRTCEIHVSSVVTTNYDIVRLCGLNALAFGQHLSAATGGHFSYCEIISLRDIPFKALQQLKGEYDDDECAGSFACRDENDHYADTAS